MKTGGIDMKVTLKDGSSKEYSQAMSIIDIAKDISEGLARVACGFAHNSRWRTHTEYFDI